MGNNKSKNNAFIMPGQLTLWDIEITEKSKKVGYLTIRVVDN